jgi:UDP-N-acetylmuramoyl-tripeptide--D-alanyl-D-alanine ligase
MTRLLLDSGLQIPFTTNFSDITLPNLLLTQETIFQDLTASNVESLPSRLVRGFGFYENSVSATDLVIAPPTLTNDQQIRFFAKSIKKNPCGIVSQWSHDSGLSSVPCFKVPSTEIYFRRLALLARQAYEGIVIMIIGSHGKTSIKNQLGHMLSQVYNCHYYRDSKNQSWPVYKTLASIPVNTQIVIIEVATAAQGVALTRSSLIQPHLVVVTHLGYDHMKCYQSIDELIANKFQVFSSMSSPAICLLPYQAELASIMHSELSKYNVGQILSYGFHSSCDVQLLSVEHHGFSQSIRFRIEDSIYNRCVPGMESYAPEQAAASFLVCALCNCLDSSSLIGYSNYKSSGNLYQCCIDGKTIFLYDQTARGNMDGFSSSLDVVNTIRTLPIRRKIAIFGPIYDPSYNLGFNMNCSSLIDKLQSSCLDILYTVFDFYDVHGNIDFNFSTSHYVCMETLAKQLLQDIRHGDFYVMRASSNKYELAEIRRTFLRVSSGFSCLY